MATYYISTTGSDSNGGSIGSPWATLPHALGVISGGDTILFQDGTYDEYLHPSYVVPSGSVGAPTIIAAVNTGMVTWQPTDTGTRVVTLGESAVVEYLTLRGIIFDGVNQNGFFSDGIKLVATSNIIIEDFELKNIWNNGILSEGSFITYRNGSIHDTGLNPGGSGPNGHGIYEGGDNVLIEGMEIYNIPGWGIQLQYDTCHDCEARYNNVHDCGQINGGGIVLSSFGSPDPSSPGFNNFVHDNIVHDTGGTGVSVGGGGDGITHDNRVYNNTIYNTVGFGLRIGLAESNQIKNNIIYVTSVDIEDDSGGLSNTLSNNLTGTDPLFVNAGSGDFHLQSGSPARDAGATLTDVTQDYEGNIRPQGGSYDIGAYEFFTGSFNATITPDTGSLSISGNSPTIGRSFTITPGTGALALTGIIPGGFSQRITPSTGSLQISGNQPGGFNQFITPGTGSLQFTGQAPDSSKIETKIIPGTGTLSFVGEVPTGFEAGYAYPGVLDPILVPLKLTVFDAAAPKMAANVKTALATTVYSKTVPGGTLKTRNCLYMILQLGTCSLFRRPCPDDEEPGEQQLSEIALLPDNPDSIGQNRSGWSMIGVDPVTQEEIVYVKLASGFGLSGTGALYKITGTDTITRLSSEQNEGGGTYSNNFGGLADKPMWVGRFNGVAGLHIVNTDETVTSIANFTGDLQTGVPWTAYGDVFYSFNGQGTIGGTGATALRAVGFSGVGNPLLGAQNTTDFNGSVWVSSCHATQTFLYAMTYNYAPSSYRILKINKNTLAIVNSYDISATDSGGFHETIFAVSDELIYFTTQINSGGSLALWYWAGGATGHLGLVDGAIANFSGWSIYGNFATFPSYKQMYVKTLGNAQYIYVGGYGNNANSTRISKIGPVFCSGL